jgi:hypothetical protein
MKLINGRSLKVGSKIILPETDVTYRERVTVTGFRNSERSPGPFRVVLATVTKNDRHPLKGGKVDDGQREFPEDVHGGEFETW